MVVEDGELEVPGAGDLDVALVVQLPELVGCGALEALRLGPGRVGPDLFVAGQDGVDGADAGDIKTLTEKEGVELAGAPPNAHG